MRSAVYWESWLSARVEGAYEEDGTSHEMGIKDTRLICFDTLSCHLEHSYAARFLRDCKTGSFSLVETLFGA